MKNKYGEKPWEEIQRLLIEMPMTRRGPTKTTTPATLSRKVSKSERIITLWLEDQRRRFQRIQNRRE